MNEPLTLDDPARYFARLEDFETHHWWPRAMRRIALGWIDQALHDRTRLTAIDVGCGNGRMVEAISAMKAIEWAYGLEPALEALGRTKKGGRPAFVRGSALQLPFQDGTTDLITSLDVLQHLPTGTDRIALAEFRRVLRAGGVLLVRANAGGQHGYTLGRLRSVVHASGFEILRASYVNGLPALAQEFRGRWIKSKDGPRPHPGGGGLPEASPKGWGSRLMGRIAAVEAEASVRLGLNLPFGHGTMILARRK